MKLKGILCSTGHGTGVLIMKAPSWPVKAKQAARRSKKLKAWLNTPEGQYEQARRMHEELRKRSKATEWQRRPESAPVPKPLGLMGKLRRLFTRAT